MTNRIVRGKLLASVAILALSSGSLGVYAADADPEQNTGGTKLEEVIVTAQKRSEDLTKVPISISVLKGDQLGSTAINDFDDLSRAVAGLSVTVGATEGNATLQLRGVSASAGASTVSTYLNEAPLTIQYGGAGGNGNAAQPIPFDISQVEVLRGPQGTLYGSLSEGGSIRFIQNKPNLNNYSGFVDGDVSGTVHGGINYETSGLENIPLIDGKLAIRVGALYGEDSGWIDHFNLSGQLDKSGVNSDTKKLLRFATLYEPTDDLSILENFTYQRYDQKDQSAFFSTLGTNESLGTQTAPGFQTTSGLFKQSAVVPNPAHDSVAIGDLEVNKNLGFAELTSVTSFYWREFKSTFDGTFFNSGAVNLFLPGSGLNPSPQIAFTPSPANTNTGWDTYTQEVRLASPSNSASPIKYVVGLYASSQTERVSNIELAPNLPSAILAANPGVPFPTIISNLGATGGNLATLTTISGNSGVTTDDTYAGFGQLTYDILPTLHLSAGIRYTITREFDTTENNSNAFFEFGLTPAEHATVNTYATTPRFSLSYDIDDLTSVYTTEAKGFRPGSAIFGLPSGSTNPPDTCLPSYQQLGLNGPPNSYRSDSLWSYEAGLKSTLADHTVSINADGYYIDWTNVQQSIPLPSCGFAFTTNAGDAVIYGSELELRYAPPVLKGLVLGVSASFNHGAISKVFPGANFAQVGEALQNVPERTATITADYDFPLYQTGGFIHYDYNFVGHSHDGFQENVAELNGTLIPNPQFENHSYGILNMQLGVNGDGWKAYLFAKNLLNDHTIFQQINDAQVVTAYTARPLTIGIGGHKDF